MTKKKNSGIKPASHRETLIQNKAYGDLKRIMGDVFEMLRYYMGAWKKEEQKKYFRHSGYVGNMKEITAGKLLEIHPERVLEKAVRGMLPKNKLGRAVFKKLKIYSGGSHPHEAQKPEVISVS